MNKKGEKDKNMRNKGITLIALVITIIVLLILAGVSIATLTGKNGILTRANDAKEQTEIASVKEQAKLDIANWVADRSRNGEDTTLDDSIIKSILEEENASNKNKYYKELQSDKIITPNGYEILYSEIYSNQGDILKIGNYVEYKPEGEVYVSSYTVQNEYSGLENSQVIYQQNTKWRILNTYDDGYVDLISDDALYVGNSENNTEPLYLSGANGYNNGIEILNTLCNNLYGNSSINATARNLSLDDIKDKMDINEWNWEDYSNSITKYGDTLDYYTNRYYPIRWYQEITGNVDGKSTNGALGISENGTLISNTEDIQLVASNKITPTNTYWVKNNMKTTNFKNSIYYELFINKDGTNLNPYWLSSRFTCVDNIDFVRWGLNRVGGGNVHGDFLYKSDNTSNIRRYAIRPVVTVNRSFIN